MFSYIEESLCFKCRYLHNTDCDGYADRPIVCSHFVFPSYLRRSSRHTQPHLPAFLKIIAGKFERLEFHAKSNPQLFFVQTWHKYDAVPVMSKQISQQVFRQTQIASPHIQIAPLPHFYQTYHGEEQLALEYEA